MKNLIRILGAAAIVLATSAVPGDAQDHRSVAAGSFFLELDGVKAGYLHSAEGGHPFSEVMVENLGSDHLSRKHIAGVQYEDFKVQIGFGLKPLVYNWIADSWKLTSGRKDGSIHTLDAHHDAKSQRKFFGALITETTIPACDGSVKDPAYITLKFAPDLTRRDTASGNLSGFLPPNQKTWLPSNFKLMIDGLDCTHVSRIEGFTVKENIVEESVGEGRGFVKVPSRTEFPNLKITFALSTSQSWDDWFDNFVIQGKNDQGQEKNGQLVFLTPDREAVLLTINFKHLGIFKLEPPKPTAKSCDCDLCTQVVDIQTENALRKLTAELYCEQMELVAPSAGD